MIKSSLISSLLAVTLILVSCSSDSVELPPEGTLAADIADKEMVLGNVIACAASNEDPSVVSVFLYPREGVSNINFYETENLEVDENNFSSYTKGAAELIDVFNGYLLKYEIVPELEKWVIVTFEENGKVHLSNPIRLKHTTNPTEYLPQIVTVDNSSDMPVFSWEDGTFEDTVIYFQVVSNENDNLLSGTYTVDQMFQYYNLDNVVLNITVAEPPSLTLGNNYNFSLLAVSEDNWVNLFAEVNFTLE
ncbi:hypothetical protein [Flagellimonas myxillae]|uniref:hypothetical protein n=1 Tax=Flagellimonas myxillae TaxID=2942214 RepID=UPI00201F8008|nr:hypothetical protein [Muricauda myxillae]MCL6267634.1 hypothetical protein [Muricauda myxillae]